MITFFFRTSAKLKFIKNAMRCNENIDRIRRSGLNSNSRTNKSRPSGGNVEYSTGKRTEPFNDSRSLHSDFKLGNVGDNGNWQSASVNWISAIRPLSVQSFIDVGLEVLLVISAIITSGICKKRKKNEKKIQN